MDRDRELYTIREVDEIKIIRNVRDRMGENVSQVPVKVVIKDVEKNADSPATETGPKNQTSDKVPAETSPVRNPDTNVNKDESSNGDSNSQPEEVGTEQIKIKTPRENILQTTKPEEATYRKVIGWNRDYGPVTITQACLLILSGLSFTLAIPMMVIGSINYEECPGGWFVPIYLIVGGCFGLVLSSFMTGDIVLRYPCRLSGFTYSMFWISVVWHCIGLIMTIRLRYIQFHDRTIAHYCNYLVYHFALYLSSGLIVAFIIIICILIFICVCHSSY